MRIETTMAALGGLASVQQLWRSGLSRHALDRARGEGLLLSPRRGWLATTDAPQPAVIAVLHSARTTAATALRSHGVWSGEDDRVHLQVEPERRFRAYPAAVPLERFAELEHTGRQIVRHWAPSRHPLLHEPHWHVPIQDALLRHAVTVDDEQAIAAITSALVQHRISRAELDALLVRLPRRLRRLRPRISLLDGSGLETIARLRLETARLRLEQQVQIGPDRVDLVIDGWLVVEVDGEQWHQPQADRDRTNRLVRAGFRVLRFGYRDIMHDWPRTEATVFSALAAPGSATSGLPRWS